ncbi:MAG: NADH-quinone oxidoreductase subunit C [Brevundimonas sp.]
MNALEQIASTEAALTPLGTEMVAELGVEARVAFGELTLVAPRERIVEVLGALRDRFGFQQLIDVCGVDYPDRAERFEVVYHLLSLTRNARVRIKVSTDETTPVPSAVSVYPAADWFEREAFDLYGTLFSGHPDLRRILTDYGFEGHPLRKDFPMTGYVEVRYDEAQKRVVYEPVRLQQEFRNFDFLSPWEGAEYPAPVLPGDEKAAPPPPAPPPAPAASMASEGKVKGKG